MITSDSPSLIKWFAGITIADVPLVGGKNASLGEMVRKLTGKGVKVPDGFATTAEGYCHFIHEARYHDLMIFGLRRLFFGETAVHVIATPIDHCSWHHNRDGNRRPTRLFPGDCDAGVVIVVESRVRFAPLLGNGG